MENEQMILDMEMRLLPKHSRREVFEKKVSATISIISSNSVIKVSYCLLKVAVWLSCQNESNLGQGQIRLSAPKQSSCLNHRCNQKDKCPVLRRQFASGHFLEKIFATASFSNTCPVFTLQLYSAFFRENNAKVQWSPTAALSHITLFSQLRDFELVQKHMI